ncbi:dipeptidase [Govanella unica]|uniref:Dipeptidase n=1 Tax=Govanella unica TaxID=2975056 RepID=A0A9X3TZC1_9PROT|nr:membrane dipeptidase [Govania unica]MDA5194751.1 dipeptidase [Govania unica]
MTSALSETAGEAFGRGRSLLRDSIVWDNHACMPMRPDQSFLGDIERCRDAGVNVVTLNIGFGSMGFEDHARIIAAQRNWYARQPDKYALVRTAADIKAAKAAGKLSILFDIEGIRAVEDDLSFIQLFYDLGVRWMLIAYNKANKAGGGCQDAEDPGLSDFGRDAVQEMERVGMLPCISHTGLRTSRDVLEMARGPVILSHSNPRALVDHPRNVPDDILTAVAASGGVIGINGIGRFLGDMDVSAANFVRHVDYVAKLVGPRHVGISLDYTFDMSELTDYVTAHPELFPPELGYDGTFKYVTPEQFPEIAEILLDRGYSADEASGILGGNWLRLAETVWK